MRKTIFLKTMFILSIQHKSIKMKQVLLCLANNYALYLNQFSDLYSWNYFLPSCIHCDLFTFQGKWKPRMIANPEYFEDLEPYKMTPIVSVAQ